jgi:hypothetical protein
MAKFYAFSTAEGFSFHFFHSDQTFHTDLFLWCVIKIQKNAFAEVPFIRAFFSCF